ALLGALVALAMARPAPADAAAERAEHQRATSTLEVRREIALGALKLIGEAPVLGRAPGQFAVLYPRVRSQHEIELSSQQRQFPTEVRTAHNDWLELLVDGGALALLLFGALLVALWRGQPDHARLLPLAVLLLLMVVRAPLWNAPAVVAALWLAGSPGPPRPTGPWTRLRVIAWGLALLALGAPLLIGNHHAARYQAAVARDDTPPADALAAAAWWMPFEPRWLELQTRVQIAAGRLPEAARLAARAIELRPNHPQLYLNLGEALAQGGKFAEAHKVAAFGLVLDSGHPELRVLASTALAQLGDVDGAIVVVADRPHPRLRKRLERHFLDLAQVVQQRGDGRAAARFLLERHVVGALDSLGESSSAGLAAAQEHIRESLQSALTAERRDDARPLVLSALQFLALGDRDRALALGRSVANSPPLTAWQRELFGTHLDRLAELATWRPFLDRR
ncbi:MAG: tetratricopeptide repeat protein, partial [Planctomycetota bacterium]